MSWQDMVLMVGNIIFVISLFPSILTKNKPSIWTSILSAVVLYIFVITYISLSLWGSAIATLIVSILWTILAIQKYFLDKKSK